MDEDRYASDDSYSDRSYRHMYFRQKSPELAQRADTVLHYDIDFIEGTGSKGKCM